MKPLQVVALVAVFVSSAVELRSQSWNAVTEFSTTANPNGVWSYGTKSLPTATALCLYTVPAWLHPNAGPCASSSSWPNVTAWSTPDWLYVHPKDQTAIRYSCVRWTAPVAGVFEIASAFRIGPGGFPVGSCDVYVAAALTGQPSAVSIDVLNVGQTSASGRVDFYEGNPANGGMLIGSDTDTVGFGVPKTFSTTWTPTVAGLRSLFAVVTNLSFVDAVTTNNQAQANVWVNAPVELLVVHPSEVTGWPGGTFETTFTIENAGSTAATISGFFSSGGWVSFPNPPVGQTLTPGQALQVTASVTIPGGTVGGVGVPETYPLGLTALTAAGGFYAGTLVARVYASPPLTVTVTVVNATNNAPLAGATVAVDGSPATWSTNGAGQVAIPLPEGQRGFYAYRPGFIAGQEIASVTAAAPNVTIALQPGQTLEVQTIVSQPLTTAEAQARGVSGFVPGNNVVYDFVVALQVGPPLVLPNVVLPIVLPPPNVPITFGGPCVCAGGATGYISATFTYPAPNVRHETWIIIPGSVWALKEFRDATIVVRNNAVATPPSAIRFENVAATLTLPAGLSFPDLNGSPQWTGGDPQVSTKTLPILNAGEQAQANWVIRGDVAGTYQLAGSATGDLWLGSPGAFAATVTAAATSEPFTVELPQLRLAFTTPTSVVAGQPFDFEVHVTNEGQATAQLVRVSLKVEDLVNCSPDPVQPGPAAAPPPTPTVCAACNCSPCFSAAPQPTSFYYDAFSAVTRMEVDVGDIPPGQTAGARFRLISHVTGVVLQVQTQVWNATTASPPVTSAQAYPGTPPTAPDGGCVMLSGVNVPVAGGDAGYLKVVPNAPGNTLALTVATTNPALLGNPYLLAIDAFTPNGAFDLPPVPYGLPGLWVGPNAVVVLDGSSQGYVLVPGGNHLLLPFPPGLSGFHLLLQAAVGAPGGYCATDAHEFVFE
jgi:hypothetical protein